MEACGILVAGKFGYRKLDRVEPFKSLLCHFSLCSIHKEKKTIQPDYRTIIRIRIFTRQLLYRIDQSKLSTDFCSQIQTVENSYIYFYIE